MQKIKNYLITHKIGFFILTVLLLINPILLIIGLIIFWIDSNAKKQAAIKNEQRQKTIQKLQESGITFELFFIKASKYRKKDPELKNKQDCQLKINNDIFQIIQESKQLKNNTTSIHEFRFWDYNEYTYFVIKMISHTEYMFSVDTKQEEALTTIAKTLKIPVDKQINYDEEDK